MPPRANLCGVANDCPVLLVLLWCLSVNDLSVNDEVPLDGAAAAAQGRVPYLGLG